MDPQQNPSTNAVLDLTTVVTDVLGDLAFMIAEDEAIDPSTGPVWLQGEIRYEGPARGTLCLWCTRDFATRLAANLLGLEPEEGTAQVGAEDAVREFMNVLCGQLVTSWYGSGPVFNLSIPAVREQIDAPALGDVERHQRVQICVEGEPLFCTHRREK